MQVAAFGAGKATFRANLLRGIKSKKDWLAVDAVSRELVSPLESPANKRKIQGKWRLQLKLLRGKSPLESPLAGKTEFLRRFGTGDRTGNEQGIQIPCYKVCGAGT
jgi:hypothetical protein